MTKRDLFILLIKVFGLYAMLIALFSVLPANISFALSDMDVFSLFWIVVVLLLIVGLFLILIYRADKIVSLLKLDKGFDDDRIDLGNLKTADLLKISIFIIGGLLVLNNISPFLSHTYFAFKGNLNGLEHGTKEKFDWAVNALNLIVGFLLLTQYRWVTDLFKSGEKENNN